MLLKYVCLRSRPDLQSYQSFLLDTVHPSFTCLPVLVSNFERITYKMLDKCDSHSKQLNSVLIEKVPVIRRFSGGGSVKVDTGTIFVILICNNIDPCSCSKSLIIDFMASITHLQILVKSIP